MNLEVIRADGDLKREVWNFSLNIGYDSPRIYFDYYAFQTRPTTRYKKWYSQTHWGRLEHRENNTNCPPLPSDVEAEMRKRYQETIMRIPITR